MAEQYTIKADYNGGSTLVFYGQAVPGTATSAAGWQIMKNTYSGTNLTDSQWAGGNSSFDKIWDNRASYSYS